MILHTWQIPLFLLPNSEKNVFNTKRRMLRADIAAWRGGQIKLTHCMYFPWPPIETGLSVATFWFLCTHARKVSFVFTQCLWPVDRRKKLPSITYWLNTIFYVNLRLRCCNLCWLQNSMFLTNLHIIYLQYTCPQNTCRQYNCHEGGSQGTVLCMTYHFVTKETQKSVTISGEFVKELLSSDSSADAQFLATTKIIAWWKQFWHDGW